MRKAFFLATTSVIVAYLTVLLVQGINNDISMVHELAIQRSSVIKLSSCADSIKEDLPRYLRSEVEKEVFLSAELGNLPDPSNIETKNWIAAAIEYLKRQNVKADIEIEIPVFRRTATNPEGAIECIVPLRYALKDQSCETELEDQADVVFIVPVRIYLISDMASSFRATVISRIKRLFMQNIGSDYQDVRKIIIKTIDEYESNCERIDLYFRASVDSEVVRDNETVRVKLSFEDTQITDMSALAQVVVDGKTTKVTFKAQASTITLSFKRH
jgi:hypothetical protein